MPGSQAVYGVLGLDPGIRVTGYAVVRQTAAGIHLVEAGLVRPAGRSLSERLGDLFQDIQHLIHQHRPQALAIESLYAHYAHPRTAILMGHARGCLLLAAALASIPVYAYSATHIKRLITGHGRADKEQIQRVIQEELALASRLQPHDVADAVAVALCHCYTHGRGIGTPE
ncbi:MAG: crossover junction endodeoxyribonuclease RuvC [Gemmataceae bacterium]